MAGSDGHERFEDLRPDLLDARGLGQDAARINVHIVMQPLKGVGVGAYLDDGRDCRADDRPPSCREQDQMAPRCDRLDDLGVANNCGIGGTTVGSVMPLGDFSVFGMLGVLRWC